MITPAIVSLTFAGAPVDTRPSEPFAVDSVETVEHGEELEILAREGGDIVASIVAVDEPDGLHISADYADGGWAEFVISPERVLSSNYGGGLTGDELADRMDVILRVEQASWTECGIAAGATVIFSVAEQWPAAIVAGTQVACKCVPLVTDWSC